ncbi:MAG: response regulator transcription factor [Clostridium sp.]|nr:response regulator transcription factor [Clostridium sp.]MCM1443713.1 response regulator transcription factor [Candidatus Amulumruptor caecigallinarius]
MRILVVEDEYKLADLIQSRLKKENYSIDISLDGEDGLYNALQNIYDLIILDVMLPKKDGFEILKELKKNNINSNVIMLTAKASLDDKLEGFDGGADDYLTKPFHMEELVARVNARLRKNSIDKSVNILSFEDIKLDLKKTLLICVKTEEEIEVVCKELSILECLIKNSNQVVSKDFLYDNVWGINNDTISNNLEAYISFIRKKLKAIGSRVGIKAVRGLGYKLEVYNEKAD